jgi:uncharacterized membrane protein YagU involved in acid resistance
VHWVVVVPFYFFAALTAFLLLTVVSRLVRLRLGANAVATAAVVLAVAIVALPLALDWIDLEDLSGRRLLALGAASFVLAALDTLLQPLLPLPADRDLAQF